MMMMMTKLIYVTSILLTFLVQLHQCEGALISYTYYRDDEPAIYASFSTPDSVVNFTHMTLDASTGRLYVGASNWLYQFNADLTLEHRVRTGPVEDSAQCSPSDCGGVEGHLVRETNNINKVLVIDTDSRMLVVCGSVHQGSCKRHRLDNIRYFEPEVGMPVAANDENSSTVAFVGPARYFGNTAIKVLYVAASNSRLGPYRDMVPAISSRYLEAGSRLFHIIEKSFTDTARVDISFHLRDYYLVKYIYGFHSNDFVYFATVQRKSSLHALEEWGYVTRLARVCASDAGFHSYTEITISCSSHGRDYNLLQDAHVTKAGPSMADDLRIERGSEVLVGVFVESKDHTNLRMSSHSAVCIFPLVDIEQKFEENIHMCYNGSVGSRNMNYIAGGVDECPRVGKAGNVVNFCHETLKLNGTQPLSSEPILVYDNITLTAVTATAAGDHMVAFLGTAEGSVKKIQITNSRQAQQVDQVVVDKGHPILTDIHLDHEKKFIFAASPYKVAKIKVERRLSQQHLNRTTSATSKQQPSFSSEATSGQHDSNGRTAGHKHDAERPPLVHERPRQHQRPVDNNNNDFTSMSRHNSEVPAVQHNHQTAIDDPNGRGASQRNTDQDERLRHYEASIPQQNGAGDDLPQSHSGVDLPPSQHHHNDLVPLRHQHPETRQEGDDGSDMAVLKKHNFTIIQPTNVDVGCPDCLDMEGQPILIVVLSAAGSFLIILSLVLLAIYRYKRTQTIERDYKIIQLQMGNLKNGGPLSGRPVIDNLKQSSIVRPDLPPRNGGLIGLGGYNGTITATNPLSTLKRMNIAPSALKPPGYSDPETDSMNPYAASSPLEPHYQAIDELGNTYLRTGMLGPNATTNPHYTVIGNETLLYPRMLHISKQPNIYGRSDNDRVHTTLYPRNLYEAPI
ncbi:Plexin-B [Halotydeus destructor]|nr:Plexin-B [Halotydeus destructor]